MNVTVRGAVKRTEEGEIYFDHLIVPLDKGGYCLTVPYLRQGDSPESATYAEGVQTKLLSRNWNVGDETSLLIAKLFPIRQ